MELSLWLETIAMKTVIGRAHATRQGCALAVTLWIVVIFAWSANIIEQME